ncbi:MAG TPA: LamG-like jellyroll fold domain-containing protein [Candidatus Dormibacteraeota bacterium]|nr:LamG-like jellyroll fold domain-containing protein [Candidatus Dormibacteraeota bacterium]
MVTAGGSNAAQSDGGDIRFSSDSAGASQLACEIVTWAQNANPSLASAEIWVPVNVLTASDVTIYVWYKAGGGITQPAANAAFGSQAVWGSQFVAVYHLNEASNAQALDSTSHGYHSTVNLSTQTAGKIGNGQSFTAASSENLAIPAQQPFGQISCTAWVKTTGMFPIWDPRRADGFGCVFYTDVDGKFKIYSTNGAGETVATTATNITNGSWHYVAGTESTPPAATGRVYSDGSTAVSGGWTADNGGSTTGRVAKFFDIGFKTGNVDELHILNVELSANWITTEYHNQNSPGTFIIPGTPVGIGGGGATSTVSATCSIVIPPALGTPTGIWLDLWVWRQMWHFDALTDAATFPPVYLRALVMGLARELCKEYGRDPAVVEQQANQAMGELEQSNDSIRKEGVREL